MADRLYFRGLGYKHKAEKIFHHPDTGVVRVPYVEHYPPDTNAASLWLRNRQPDRWRAAERVDVNVKGSLTHRLNQMTLEERGALAREMAAKIRQRLADAGITIEHDKPPFREDEDEEK